MKLSTGTKSGTGVAVDQELIFTVFHCHKNRQGHPPLEKSTLVRAEVYVYFDEGDNFLCFAKGDKV